MYIQGAEYSQAHTIITLGGVPFLFSDLSWKLKKMKTQNKANFNKVTSITYGVEEIESISIKITQQQAFAIRKSAATQKLTDIAPQTLAIVLGDGGLKRSSFILSDFEFLEDGLDSSTPDNPTQEVTLAAIASDIQIIGV